MKRALIGLLVAGCLTGCEEQKSQDLESVLPAYGIRDIYEHVNADGLCPTYFGDSTNGCVKHLQITRFADGSAYFFVSMGPNGTTWSWAEYLPEGTTTFSREFPLGGTARYRLDGDLSPAVPTLSMLYDHDINYATGSIGQISLTVVAQ